MRVAADAVRARHETVERPCAVTVWHYIPRPPSHHRVNGELRTTAPRYPVSRRAGDVDKLARATLDGLTVDKHTGRGILADDSLVIDLHTHKRYADAEHPPGATITIDVRTDRISPHE